MPAGLKTTTRNDLLEMLLAAQDEETGQGMSDQQVRDEVAHLADRRPRNGRCRAVMDLVPAGAAPRDSAERLRRAASASFSGGRPTVADLPDLPLTRAAFDEALRLYPPATGQPRQALGEDEIGGHRIPKKSIVMVCQYITHRHPEFWDDPERFDPKRFLPGQGGGRPKFAYFPFGGGPRSCIGNHFALMEATLVLATIVQRYRIELVPDQRVTPDATFTLRPKPGVQVTLWPR